MHPHIHWRKKEIHFYFAGCGLPDLCDIHGRTRMPDLFKSVENSIKYTINAFQEEVLKNFFTVFYFFTLFEKQYFLQPREKELNFSFGLFWSEHAKNSFTLLKSNGNFQSCQISWLVLKKSLGERFRYFIPRTNVFLTDILTLADQNEIFFY